MNLEDATEEPLQDLEEGLRERVMLLVNKSADDDAPHEGRPLA